MNNNRKRMHSKRHTNKRRAVNARVIRTIESRRNPSYPPQNNTKPVCNRNLRYIATQAVTNIDVTGRCLLNLVLGVLTSTTTAINIYEAVKVNRVSLYYAPSSANGLGTTADELVLNWRGERSPDTRLSDRGSISHPSCIKSEPPKDSLAAFWITNQSNIDTVLFNLTCPANSIIDVSLSLTIGDGATRSVTLSAVGANNGLSYMPLDNAVAAGTVGGRFLAPDSLTTQSIATP